MDVIDEFLLAFWRALESNKVRYLMIGGFAVRFHGFNRATDDLDIWIEDTLENRRNLHRVLCELENEAYPSLDEFTFVPGWSSFRVGPGIELDILTELKGVEANFQECLNVASFAEILDVKVPFLHINQLIANKKHTNRPKDILDAAELEKIKIIRDGNKD